jgi:hypothetical protein
MTVLLNFLMYVLKNTCLMIAYWVYSQLNATI